MNKRFSLTGVCTQKSVFGLDFFFFFSKHCSLNRIHQTTLPDNYALRVWKEADVGRTCPHAVQSAGATLSGSNQPTI